MKILSVEQVRALDAYTIDHEPVAPIDLMERAATAFVNWFVAYFSPEQPVKIFCGMGNNGGDGLAIARLLFGEGYRIEVWVVRHLKRQKDDFTINFKRLQMLTHINFVEHEDQIPGIRPQEVVIDAMLGSGITRPMEGITRSVAERINQHAGPVVSVDVASGLFADHPNQASDCLIRPTHTVSFELPKLAFVLPQLAEFVGQWHIVPIGLSQDFIQQSVSPYYYATPPEVEQLLRPRSKFTHKGSYGHALLVAGSHGSMGAAVLAARACLRSGVGLLTAQVPQCGYDIMQISVPEAMCTISGNKTIDVPFVAEALQNYSAIAVGPGLGVAPQTIPVLDSLLRANLPLVLDADALNLLSSPEGRALWRLIPPATILTPHPKEFKRLLGRDWQHDYQKLELLRSFCVQHQVIVTLKGAHTAVGLPSGEVYFNATGNPGMATGGSGDVLTGILVALLAQGYAPAEAAILGVYQHGLAGDRAAQQRGMLALTASDIIEQLRW